MWGPDRLYQQYSCSIGKIGHIGYRPYLPLLVYVNSAIGRATNTMNLIKVLPLFYLILLINTKYAELAKILYWQDQWYAKHVNQKILPLLFLNSLINTKYAELSKISYWQNISNKK